MKISIITATYNSGTTLADTIESVLSQTHKDIEYIVIDGGSTDNTMNIVKHYEPHFDGRMKYVSEKDNGIYDAMNKGIRKATGDIIGILNSDDYYSAQDILEKVVDKFNTTDVDAIYGDLHYVNGNNKEKCVRYYSSKIFSPGIMRFGFIPAHPTFYCRREIYEQCGLYNTSYKIAADFEALLRMIFINKIKISYLPIDLVTMRLGGASTANAHSRWIGMQEHRKALKNNGIYSNYLMLGILYAYRAYEMLLSPIKYKKSLKRFEHKK